MAEKKHLAKKITLGVSPLAWLIWEAAEKSYELVQNASNKSVSEYDEEVAKQSIKMQFAKEQARVEQELAIARRIDGAEEVEIEEFYDVSGKGHVGLSVDQDQNNISLGVGGEGNQVTKRVYKFKGWRPNDNEGVVEQNFDE